MRFLRPILHHSRTFITQNPLLTLILALALMVRCIGLLPNDMYNSDEVYIRDHAGRLFYQIITQGDFDPHTYKYGSGIFYFAAVFYLPYLLVLYGSQLLQHVLFFDMAGFQTFGEFVREMGPFHESVSVLLLQRLSIAVIGVWSVYLVYRVAGELFQQPVVSYIAALLLAVSPLHVRDSHYITTDVPFTFFILLSVYVLSNIIKTGRMKWYIAAGLLMGFTSTIRYFPIILVAYPIAAMLDRDKSGIWLLKVVNGVMYFIIGVALGVPFLIIKADTNIPLFVDEMNRFVLPWYQTGISSYVVSLVKYLMTFGGSDLPPLSSLIPHNYQDTYVTLLMWYGLGIPALIVSIAGIVIGLVKKPMRTTFLLAIPFVLLVYISFYIRAKYDRLAIPALPFLAIFAGLFFAYLWKFLQNLRRPASFLLAGVVGIAMIFFPLTGSFASSMDCSREHPFDISDDWISKHIPAGAVVAFKTHLPFPSDKDITTIEIRPDREYFLEEASLKGAEYAFINKSALLNFMGTLKEDFIIPPPELYENYYVNLGFYEYLSRAELLHAITSHEMCAHPELYYFKLPERLSPAVNLVYSYTFDTPESMGAWHFQEYSHVSEKAPVLSFVGQDGGSGSGALSAQWLGSNHYVPERILSEKIPVDAGEVYTLTGSIKISETVQEIVVERGIGERDGFLRMDFYPAEDADITIPGNVVALTPRTFGEPAWRPVSVTVRAPEDAVFAVISLQASGTKPYAQYLFDDITLYTSSSSLVLQ